MEEIIYFELNDWFPDRDYPTEEPFLSWMEDPVQFDDDNWVKANKLVVVECMVDMSLNFCVSAKKSWVEDNCPSLLTKYTKFLRFKNEKGEIVGNFANCLEYSEENIGIHFLKNYQ